MNGLAFPGTAKRRPLSANMGGPMSRTRKERVSSTLLGRDGGPIRCPRVIRLGLDFGGKAPVETLGRILAEEGYGSQEDLREDFPLPERRLVCRRHVAERGVERLLVGDAGVVRCLRGPDAGGEHRGRHADSEPHRKDRERQERQRTDESEEALHCRRPVSSEMFPTNRN